MARRPTPTMLADFVDIPIAGTFDRRLIGGSPGSGPKPEARAVLNFVLNSALEARKWAANGATDRLRNLSIGYLANMGAGVTRFPPHPGPFRSETSNVPRSGPWGA